MPPDCGLASFGLWLCGWFAVQLCTIHLSSLAALEFILKVLKSKVPGDSFSIHTMILSAFFVLCLTLPLFPSELIFFPQKLINSNSKTCTFLAWLHLLLFLLSFPLSLEKAEKEKENGSVQHGAIQWSLFLVVSFSVWRKLLWQPWIHLSASELTLSFLIIISFPWDDFLQFFKIGFSSWNFLETNFFFYIWKLESTVEANPQEV